MHVGFVPFLGVVIAKNSYIIEMNEDQTRVIFMQHSYYESKLCNSRQSYICCVAGLQVRLEMDND